MMDGEKRQEVWMVSATTESGANKTVELKEKTEKRPKDWMVSATSESEAHKTADL